MIISEIDRYRTNLNAKVCVSLKLHYIITIKLQLAIDTALVTIFMMASVSSPLGTTSILSAHSLEFILVELKLRIHYLG